MFIYQIFVFILGLIIGSFLNVVILRYGSGISVNGRSFCMNCNKKLHWYELIPLFSFLIQKGKCRGCKSKISWQYPTVEILTALIFLLIFIFDLGEILQSKILLLTTTTNYLLFSLVIYHWIIFSILTVLTVYDIKHKIIPDKLVFIFIGLSFVGLLFGFGPEINKLNFLAGPILAAPFAFLWLISKGEWIGLGDAKIVLGIGWFMGLIDGLSSVILAFWIGSVFGVLLILFSKLHLLFFKDKNFTIKSEIPFAPFLILGMILVFFFGFDVLGLNNF